MIETKDIKNMVAHILKRDKGIADTHIMHPVREWFIGLSTTTLVVALGSWFCFYIYQYHNVEMQKEAVVIEQSVPYQAATVKSALELFAAKQEKFDEILDEKSLVLTTEIPAVSTSTDSTVVSEDVRDIPEVIVDPAPIFEDDGSPVEATLAP